MHGKAWINIDLNQNVTHMTDKYKFSVYGSNKTDYLDSIMHPVHTHVFICLNMYVHRNTNLNTEKHNGISESPHDM